MLDDDGKPLVIYIRTHPVTYRSEKGRWFIKAGLVSTSKLAFIAFLEVFTDWFIAQPVPPVEVEVELLPYPDPVTA